jgi:hypothetical protein
LRLQETDADLYGWADEWVLADEGKCKVKGTQSYSVLMILTPKPWLHKSKALNISEDEMKITGFKIY